MPINFLTSFSAFIGSAVEVVLLSLAMGDKMRFEQQNARKEIANLAQDLQARNEQISSMNEKLEVLVEDKTWNIRSILKNIRQGLFLIGPDRKILPDTSDFLYDIFEGRAIEGQDAFALLFRQSDISMDALNQADSALSAAFNENVLVFDMNEHLLCREVIHKNRQGEPRILEYNWSPMIKEGVLDKILVTVKDVTEQKMLEIKHREKEEELNIISEIVNADRSIFM